METNLLIVGNKATVDKRIDDIESDGCGQYHNDVGVYLFGRVAALAATTIAII